MWQKILTYSQPKQKKISSISRSINDRTNGTSIQEHSNGIINILYIIKKIKEKISIMKAMKDNFKRYKYVKSDIIQKHTN